MMKDYVLNTRQVLLITIAVSLLLASSYLLGEKLGSDAIVKFYDEYVNNECSCSKEIIKKKGMMGYDLPELEPNLSFVFTYQKPESG